MHLTNICVPAAVSPAPFIGRIEEVPALVADTDTNQQFKNDDDNATEKCRVQPRNLPWSGVRLAFLRQSDCT